jgi:hypothetical protein
VDFKRPQEFSVVYGSCQANGSGGMVIREELRPANSTEYPYEIYAVKVRIPTISQEISNVRIQYSYFNVWGAQITVHRIAIYAEGVPQPIAQHAEEKYGDEDNGSGIVITTTLNASVTNADEIEAYLAISAAGGVLGSTITLRAVLYDVYSLAQADNPGEEECSIGATAGQGSK